MTLSLEMNMIDGAFAVKIAGAARKRRKGLAWKSVRGLRPWQMYVYTGGFLETWEVRSLLPHKRPEGNTGTTTSWYC